MFLKYAISRYKHEQMDMAYAIYITDTLYYHNQNKGLSTRFYDLIHKDSTPDIDGNDIVNDIMSRAGLRFKE